VRDDRRAFAAIAGRRRDHAILTKRQSPLTGRWCCSPPPANRAWRAAAAPASRRISGISRFVITLRAPGALVVERLLAVLRRLGGPIDFGSLHATPRRKVRADLDDAPTCRARRR
jgi:hypothetical protein